MSRLTRGLDRSAHGSLPPGVHDSDPPAAQPPGRGGGRTRGGGAPERWLAIAAVILAVGAVVGGRWTQETAPEEAPVQEAPAEAPTSGDETGSATPSPDTSADATSPGATSPEATVSATPSVPQRGAGTTTVLAVPGQDSDRAGREVRYTVEAEVGAGIDEAQYARIVRQVLTDERGWEAQDGVHFVNVTPQEAAAGAHVQVHMIMATPDTVDRLCAPLQTEGEVSCRNGDRVVLNARRWAYGARSYGEDLDRYRQYLINHEMGHAIGHDHEPCPGPGLAAPVMLQQTLGLDGCTKYPWPVRGREF